MSAEPVPVELASRPTGVPPDTAAADVVALDVARLRALVDGAGDADVTRALARPRRTLEDFAALLSDAAGARIEELAQVAHDTTVRRFGRTIHLFAPLYLSN